MNKNLLYIGIFSCIFCTTSQPFWPQVPTNFELATPTNFTITTALDNLSVSNISQTTAYIAAFILLYHACVTWAQAATPSDGQPAQDERTKHIVMQQRIKAALRYLLSASTFTATGLLIRYAPQILHKLRTIICH